MNDGGRNDEAFLARARPIRLLLSDMDGVLNDGLVTFDERGGELKQFHIRDGLGIKLWQRAGHGFGIVTGRTSSIVERRAGELGIKIVRQGAEDKLAAVKQILDELKLPPEQAAYIGDDLPDVPAMAHVGLGVTVADGCGEARERANYITKTSGGRGAVRELIEAVLAAQEKWDVVTREYVI